MIMDNLGPLKTLCVLFLRFFLPHFVFTMLVPLQHASGGEEKERGSKEKGGVSEQQAAS